MSGCDLRRLISCSPGVSTEDKLLAVLGRPEVRIPGRGRLLLIFHPPDYHMIVADMAPDGNAKVSYVRRFSARRYDEKLRARTMPTAGEPFDEMDRIYARVSRLFFFGLRDGGFEAPLTATWAADWTVRPVPSPVWWARGAVRASGGRDSSTAKSGEFSLKIVNESSQAPGRYLTTSQRLGVERGERYIVSFWAKAAQATPGAFEVVVDRAWKTRLTIRPGTYDWEPFEMEFVPDASVIELRLLSEDVGVVWIDDLDLRSR